VITGREAVRFTDRQRKDSPVTRTQQIRHTLLADLERGQLNLEQVQLLLATYRYVQPSQVTGIMSSGPADLMQVALGATPLRRCRRAHPESNRSQSNHIIEEFAQTLAPEAVDLRDELMHPEARGSASPRGV
jgi:hypothetical protein